MIDSSDYFYCSTGIMFSSQSGFKRIDCCLLATPSKIFVIPTKSVGTYVLFNTIKTHQYFQGKDIDEGLREVINGCDSIEQLEKSISALLNHDEKYITPVQGNSSFRFSGFFGKQTLRIGITKMKWISFSCYKKADSVQFRKYYSDVLVIS